MTLDNARLYEQFVQLIAAAVIRDNDQVADLLGDIGEERGSEGIFATCCALAQTVLNISFPKARRGDGSLTGDMIIIEQSSEDSDHPRAAPALWAARFVAAYANGDNERCADLFFSESIDTSSDRPDFIIVAVVELLRMAADVVRAQDTEVKP